MKPIITVLTLCIICLLTSCDNFSSPNRRVVNSWLTDLKNGGDGSSYWEKSEDVVRLYAVRSWEILSEEQHEIIWIDGEIEWGDYVKVRIDSSNKAGMQITKIWSVGIISKIVSLKED